MGQPPQKGLVMNTVKSWEEMNSIEIFALKSKKICQFIRPSRDPIIKKSLVSAFIIVSDRLSYFNAKTELKSKVGIIRTSFPWVIEWANWAKTCLGHAMRCTEMSAFAFSQSEASSQATQPIRGKYWGYSANQKLVLYMAHWQHMHCVTLMSSSSKVLEDEDEKYQGSL